MAAVQLSRALPLGPPAAGQGGGPARHCRRAGEDAACHPARGAGGAGDGARRAASARAMRLVRDAAEGHPTEDGAIAALEEALRRGRAAADALRAAWEARARSAVKALQEAQRKLVEAPEGAARDAARAAVLEARKRLESSGVEQRSCHAEVDADAVARVVARSGPASRWGRCARPRQSRCSKLEDTLAATHPRSGPAAMRTVAEVDSLRPRRHPQPEHSRGRAALRRPVAAWARPRRPSPSPTRSTAASAS